MVLEPEAGRLGSVSAVRIYYNPERRHPQAPTINHAYFSTTARFRPHSRATRSWSLEAWTGEFDGLRVPEFRF
jgi:hypothetical protein